jgi:SMC interacting uncharacterized protein involved in chromosome segregation
MAKKATKVKNSKAVETDNKGFRNVPLSVLKVYNDIKAKFLKKNPLGKDADVLTLLVNSFNGDNIPTGDTSKFTEEISTLHDEVARINKEKDLLELQITEQNNSLDTFKQIMQDHVKLCGCETSQEVIEKIKSLEQRVNLGGGVPQSELDEANAKIIELSQKLIEFQNVAETVTQINTVIGPAIIELGFKSFEEFVTQYKHVNETVNRLSKENKQLTDQAANVKPEGVQLTGKQFIADVTEDNFKIITHYAKQLYDKKIITGDREKLPNEVINWAVKKAMVFTFGKLEV